MTEKTDKITPEEFLATFFNSAGSTLVDDYEITDQLRRKALNPDANHVTGSIRAAIETGIYDEVKLENRKRAVELGLNKH